MPFVILVVVVSVLLWNLNHTLMFMALGFVFAAKFNKILDFSIKLVQFIKLKIKDIKEVNIPREIERLDRANCAL